LSAKLREDGLIRIPSRGEAPVTGCSKMSILRSSATAEDGRRCKAVHYHAEWGVLFVRRRSAPQQLCVFRQPPRWWIFYL